MTSASNSSTSMASLFDAAGTSTAQTSTTSSYTRTPATSMAMTPASSFSHLNDTSSKNIIILVGLPATGKSTISQSLATHLNSHPHLKTKVFNCGQVRRDTLKTTDTYHNYEFFDPNNKLFIFKREIIAMNSMDSLIDELESETINVGILDATNTTRERRSNLVKLVHERVANEGLVLDSLVVLDIQCTDPLLIHYNINAKTKNDDYKNQEYQQSINDFTKRLGNYRRAYQPIDEEELQSYREILASYVVVENGGADYHERTFHKSEVGNVMSEYFAAYSKYDARLYYDKVADYYRHAEFETNKDTINDRICNY
ncbi:6-phosphofructo-2-kinase [Yamadazyma tenuis]|uniref:6PF2K-domain-containing protein n=1 Tax=Candida tenuis (strain ATCC 10573 / BCRC 21748 / CBS 615 / JCM 9827 / NBRC 10315 / NRRL Y-1498 / VKM Y-70) TaxID=590646 RepID=G3BA98_CANTC|nr:6PF2K-domain-containing protein [Yamadazyma tenuis ATCC 10573]EGV61388.1 6PF2K-domain-containing protein [Yamadazyma tenuis ATCC 10573]WEJ92606.1 6-phosphofructo-2-kinase [Yamadazyma tenuis]